MNQRQDIADFLTENNYKYKTLLSFGISAAISIICEVLAKTPLNIQDLKSICDVMESQLEKEKAAQNE